MRKHRFNEVEDSTWLGNFEALRSQHGYRVISGRRYPKVTLNPLSWIDRIPSYYIWSFTLLAFATAALLILVRPYYFAKPDGREQVTGDIKSPHVGVPSGGTASTNDNRAVK